MALQPEGLVGKLSIGNGMGFTEPIGSKGSQLLKYPLGNVSVHCRTDCVGSVQGVNTNSPRTGSHQRIYKYDALLRVLTEGVRGETEDSRTEAEKNEANRMIDELFLEMIKGLNVAKQKTGRRFGDWQTWTCPQCKKQILQPRGLPTDSCPDCGWSQYTKGAVVK